MGMPLLYQETAEAADEESITIEHSDEGTKISIEDPTPLEIVALLLVLVAAIVGLVLWRRRARTP
jgi:hypothetical protein